MPIQRIHLLLLISALLLLTACTEPVPALKPLSPGGIILAFGDSLTHGTGAKADESYPSVLSQLISRQVINAGVPGELSGEGKQRLPGLLEQHQPQLLILCHGGNDLLRRKNQAQMSQNLKDMVTLARKRGIDVILLGVPEPKLFLLESAQVYKDIAKEMAIPLEAGILPQVLGDSSLKADAIHPNARGYRDVATAIVKLLQQAKALE